MMLRKIIPIGPRGHHIVGVYIRSCQSTTALTSNPRHETHIENASENASSRSKSKSSIRHAISGAVSFSNRKIISEQSCEHELGNAEKIISVLLQKNRSSTETSLAKVIESCSQSYGKTSKHEFIDRVYLWCTGALAISSVLLFKTWLTGENQKSLSLKDGLLRDAETIKCAITTCFSAIPKDHILLPVLETPKKDIKNESISSLENAARKLKIESDECSASLWNKLGLQMLKSGQEKLAAELFKMASENGNLAAIYNMALCFENGKGMEQNLTKAIEFYRIAAEKGHPRAQYNLATLYNEGANGMEKDIVKATKLLEKAAENGVTKAQIFLGCKSAKNGSQTKAAKYFGMASESKDPVAMFNYGICLENGFGVKKDMVKAGNLYEEAAENGHTSAMFNTAVFHERGHGDFATSLDKAIYWFEKAAKNGDEEAKIKLKEIQLKSVSKSETVPPALSDYLFQNILNLRQYNTAFRKSKSTPNLQSQNNSNENRDGLIHQVRTSHHNQQEEKSTINSSCSSETLCIASSFANPEIC